MNLNQDRNDLNLEFDITNKPTSESISATFFSSLPNDLYNDGGGATGSEQFRSHFNFICFFSFPLSIYLSICTSAYLSVNQSVSLSSSLLLWMTLSAWYDRGPIVTCCVRHMAVTTLGSSKWYSDPHSSCYKLLLSNSRFTSSSRFSKVAILPPLLLDGQLLFCFIFFLFETARIRG